MRFILPVLISLLVSNVSSAQITTLPFRFVDEKHVLLTIGVNEVDSLTFFFDTGATTSLIDRNVAERIGVKANYQHTVQGGGGNKTYDVALLQTLTLTNNITIDSVNLVLDDLTRLRSVLGENFDGIVGYSIVNAFITELDFDKRVMRLRPKTKLPDTTGYTRIPFEFANGIQIPQFEATLELSNRKQFTGKILFDSGAGLTLLVNTPFAEQHKLLEQSGKFVTTKRNNLSVESVTREVAANAISFGGFVFRDLPVGLASDKEGVSAFPGYLGLLGSDIIARFNFILDYDAKMLYLKPNSLFTKPFQFPVSGVLLVQKQDGVYVSAVAEESEAHKQRLFSGDKIISINGIKNGSITDYRKALEQEGKAVRLTVQTDDGPARDIKLNLKRLL